MPDVIGNASTALCWVGLSSEVIGPNGKSIVLRAAGFGSSGGSVMQSGNQGGYWTTTSNGPDTQWVLGFFSSDVTFYSYYPSWRFSVSQSIQWAKRR